MKLSEATPLLGGQARYFTEVYKLFRYTDDQSLKDYLDFIVHEPVEWLKGFPTKYRSKNSFSRPKTAVLKLLKEGSVITALGEEYTIGIHDAIWSAFKKHSDTIVAKRATQTTAKNADQEDEASVQEEQTNAAPEENYIETESLSSEGPDATPVTKWEAKYKLLESAYLDLLTSLEPTQPGLVASTRRLLSFLSLP
jgi:hypothetical protein